MAHFGNPIFDLLLKITHEDGKVAMMVTKMSKGGPLCSQQARHADTQLDKYYIAL